MEQFIKYKTFNLPDPTPYEAIKNIIKKDNYQNFYSVYADCNSKLEDVRMGTITAKEAIRKLTEKYGLLLSETENSSLSKFNVWVNRGFIDPSLNQGEIGIAGQYNDDLPIVLATIIMLQSELKLEEITKFRKLADSLVNSIDLQKTFQKQYISFYFLNNYFALDDDKKFLDGILLMCDLLPSVQHLAQDYFQRKDFKGFRKIMKIEYDSLKNNIYNIKKWIIFYTKFKNDFPLGKPAIVSIDESQEIKIRELTKEDKIRARIWELSKLEEMETGNITQNKIDEIFKDDKDYLLFTAINTIY